jgi:hypothetical protein
MITCVFYYVKCLNYCLNTHTHTHTLFVAYAHVLTWQMYFYIPPGLDMMVIKKNAFQYMVSKLKSWRHSLKRPLNIQNDDMPETVKVRMGQIYLDRYDPLDLEVLLVIWCEKKNKVGHKFYYYFV